MEETLICVTHIYLSISYHDHYITLCLEYLNFFTFILINELYFKSVYKLSIKKIKKNKYQYLNLMIRFNYINE